MYADSNPCVPGEIHGTSGNSDLGNDDLTLQPKFAAGHALLNQRNRVKRPSCSERRVQRPEPRLAEVRKGVTNQPCFQ